MLLLSGETAGEHAVPTLQQLNALDRTEFTAALGHVFEQSPWIAWACWERRPFADVEALAAALTDIMLAASMTQQLTLILGHPDLADATALDEHAADPTAAVAGAGLDRLSRQEYVLFHELNGAYWAKFGFPFVICAEVHDKASLLGEFRRRLIRDEAAERRQALIEIGMMARGHLAALLAPPAAAFPA